MRRKIIERWLAGLYGVFFLTTGPLAVGKGLSEEEILSALPTCSVIANVRTQPYKADGTTIRKKAVLQTRGNDRNDSKTIVGYYAEPDRRGEEQTATYYRRAHVALLAKENGAIKVLWDSGGWGFEFGMELTEDTYTDTQLSLFFGLRDLNGDGRYELVFSKTSFGAEGSQFEIWQYDSQKEKMTQICETSGSIEMFESPRGKWPFIRATSFHASTISTVLLEYDSDLRRYKASNSQTGPAGHALE